MVTRSAERSIHAGLSANTVDHIVLTFQPISNVRIFNRHPSGDIYVRLDGVDPAIAEDHALVIPPLEDREFPVLDPNNIDVRLISAVAATYSIEAV